jgi:hypothetical protein
MILNKQHTEIINNAIDKANRCSLDTFELIMTDVSIRLDCTDYVTERTYTILKLKQLEHTNSATILAQFIGKIISKIEYTK